jgi:hypothetical protein
MSEVQRIVRGKRRFMIPWAPNGHRFRVASEARVAIAGPERHAHFKKQAFF